MSQALDEEFISRAGIPAKSFSSPLLAASLKNPALIIHNKGDRDTDHQYSVRLHAAWEGSRLILTEGLGHGLKNRELEVEIFQFLQS